MFWRKFAYLFIAAALLAVGVLPSQIAYAQDPTPEKEGCVIDNFTFPEVTLGGADNMKFVEFTYTFDEDCNMTETSRLLDYVPEDVFQNEQPYSQEAPDAPDESLDEASASVALATLNTARVRIREWDCCGVATITLDTTHAWLWTGSVASLSGNGTTHASWCCYWWYLTAGPTKSHGTTSSTHVWANGDASYVCHNSEPTPFCVGATPRYPMTLRNRLHMYQNGTANANGTSYSGTVIPMGSVSYQFWIY